MERITFEVLGMACAGCADTVASALRILPGVLSVEVSHDTGMAMLDYDPARVGPAQFQAAVEQAGYQVKC